MKTEYITYNESAGYNQRWRRRLISSKKGVIKLQEGHVLEGRRASS